MSRRRRLQRRQERPQAPDRAEVVRPRHLLDPCRIELEEAAAARDARVVDEQLHGEVAAADRLCSPFHRVSVTDVADLPLGAELPGDCSQPRLATRDQHAAPAGLGQLAGDCGSDSARAPGDDRYRRHTRTGRPPTARAPRRSVTTARRR